MTNMDTLQKELSELQRNYIELNTKVDFILADLKKLFTALEDRYVTKEEFKPVKTLVYGLVGLILTSVFGSLILLVIAK